MPEAAVICRGVNKSFHDTPVVENLSLRVAPGHILALLGPSGCGKTTTLRLVAGFEQLDSGYIEIAGRAVAGEQLHLPPEKRRVGMVFQDYAIFPHLSVAQNIAFGLGRGQAAQERAAQMLRFVGLAGQGVKMPHELSGGQQQRVALARALAPEPAVILLDEPFSNLDAALRTAVRQEVRTLLQQSKATAVFVTHDQEEALFMGDEVAVMKDGRLQQVGTPETIFHRPRTRFVAEFMGQTDFIPGRVNSSGIATALGTIPKKTVLAADTPVEVAVRPDDVELRVAGSEENGRILSRQFTGMAYIYRVRLADGSTIHSWQPHTTQMAVGTAVQAAVRQDHTLSVFHGGEAL